MKDDRPHIAIDGRELVGQPTGVGRYLEALLTEWDKPGAPYKLTFIAPGPAAEPDILRSGRVGWKVSPAAKGGTWWEQTRLPGALASLDADVLFAPAYTAPLRCRIPTVVNIHDVSYFALPGAYRWRERQRRRIITRLAARRAAAIITVSEFSAGEIVRWVKVPRSKISVIPHGMPPVRRPSRPPSRKPTILFVGSIFNRRHPEEMVAGFARALRTVPDARLIVAGKDLTRPVLDLQALSRSMGVGDRVEWRSYVEAEELEKLYWTARAFVFLSDYEGFAMTPLEALAHDVPVVLLDTPVSREVYGRGAWLVPPDPEAISRAMASLLSDDRRRKEMLERGREVLAAHSLKRTAAQTLDVLIRAAGSRRFVRPGTSPRP